MKTTAEIASDLKAAAAHHRAGRIVKAEAGYRAVLLDVPNHPVALQGLAIIQHSAGRHEEAIALLRRATAAAPTSAEFRGNLAAVLGSAGRHDLAAAELKEVVRLRPDYAPGWSNLGVALSKSNKHKEAEVAYRWMIALRPQDAKARNLLGNVLRRIGRFAEAEECQREALRLDPSYAGAWGSLARTLSDQGRLDEAIDCCRKDAELRPNSPVAGSTLLSTLHYSASSTPKSLFDEARAWSARHAARFYPSAPSVYPNDRDPDRRLKIGFLSNNPTGHPEGRFLRPVLANLDRDKFETTVYSDTAKPDSITATLRQLADRFHDIRPHGDARVAQKIRQDQIDILIDLTGHFGNNRLLVLARKPAPVQAIHFGYPGTTGMDTVGWRITDCHADPVAETPEGERAAYTTERLIRLKDFAWCYEPPLEARAVGELPARRNGFITFICANNTVKVTSQAVALWSRILNAVPNSRLKLLGDGGKRFKEGASGGIQYGQHLLGLFAEHGVDLSRIELLARQSRSKYFEWIHGADIALDPFPYNGGITSCDTLWMGVPIVTLEGDSYWSRQGAAVLRNIELSQLIATTPDEYIRIAVNLADKIGALAELRRGLRQRLVASPIMDNVTYGRKLGGTYGLMWKTWIRESAV